MKKIPKQEYTAEFKEQAVKHAQAVGIVVAARELGLVEQTLRNWVRAAEAGKLVGAGTKPVTPEQMELSMLRCPTNRRPPFRPAVAPSEWPLPADPAGTCVAAV